MSQPRNQRGKVFRLRNRSDQEDRELANLLDVGAALSAEHETHKVLELILEKATENTNADGGSIYLVERVKQDSIGGARSQYVPMLRFSHALNASVGKNDNKFNKKLLELDTGSIAGYVALTGQSIRIRDAYTLPENAPFKFNSDLDKEQKYRTKSVLAVPIRTNKGKILGVVQLLNKKRLYRREGDIQPAKNKLSEKDIIAFSEHDDKLMHAFASHAAVALENAKLTEDIGNLFESFVKASVMAIEARDPSTSGHSDRVAQLTVRFAEVVDGVSSGRLRDIRFSHDQLREIRYASLLHDFGKIGVREHLLTKAQKLFPHELETVLLRLQTINSTTEARSWRECAEKLADIIQSKKTTDPRAVMGQYLWNIDATLKKTDQIRRGILKANESQIVDRDFNIGALMTEIKGLSQEIGQKILDEQDTIKLSVQRGTLSPEERVQIESHVSHTFEFLSQIAWTEQLQSVPEIAHAHHEKLDGTGYPRHLRADQIPIQSRMMTISDIYDALTAFDRPYKKAVDVVRAIDILNDEAKAGKLDQELLQLFIEAKIFEVSMPFRTKKAG